MNPNTRNIRQLKAEWKTRYGNDRRNGGRQGRQRDNRATKRIKRAGRGNP